MTYNVTTGWLVHLTFKCSPEFTIPCPAGQAPSDLQWGPASVMQLHSNARAADMCRLCLTCSMPRAGPHRTLCTAHCPALQALYHLQRGPMLGHILGHPDERALLHVAFLSAGGDMAWRMLLPDTYALDLDSAHAEHIPPVTMALATSEHLSGSA